VLLRGLLLLAVLVAGIFVGLRQLTKSGDEQPASSCGTAQACVTTARVLPGGWPGSAP
jgi:hypothetical protein